MNRRTLLVNALKKGGHVLSRYFGRVSYLEKGRANLVTKADLESQRTILNLIKAHVPGDDYIAEENASQSNGADYLWLIDPLDGTTNYAHGYPASCVSIGVLYRGRPILGGVYDPFRQELFLAEAGRGATLNGQRLHVSKTRRVEDSLLVTGFGYDRAERPDFYLSPFKSFLVTCHDIRRSGSAALDMAWIAAGRVDGFWELNLKPWDVAAGWLLVMEAEGKVSDFSGRRWKETTAMGVQTLATNGRIHKSMQEILRLSKSEKQA